MQWVGLTGLLLLASIASAGCGHEPAGTQDGGAPPGHSPQDGGAAPLTGQLESPALDPGALAYLALLEQARAGQPVDLDGDGVAEYLSTVSDGGAISVTIDANQDGLPEYEFTWDPATLTGTQVFDADSDGTPEFQATLSGKPLVVVALVDTNWDAVVDERRTDTYDQAQRTHRQVVEVVPDGGVGWVVVSDQTGPLAKNGTDANGFYQCDPPNPQQPNGPLANPNGTVCDAYSPPSVFPDGLHEGNRPFGIFTNHGATDGADGSCSQAHFDKLSKALSCALNQAQKCIPGMNSGVAGAMAPFLEFGHWSMACGSVCKGGAQTDDSPPCTRRLTDETGVGPGVATLCDDKYTNWSPGQLSGATDQAQCEAVLHELLHAAGVPSQDAADHDRCANDQVYTCARFCAGCSIATAPAGVGPAYDCASCADTQDKKNACGAKVKRQDLLYPVPVCHGGLGDNAECPDPVGYTTYFCDGQDKSSTGFICCASCPPDDPDNDFVCQDSDLGETADTCGQRPSVCPSLP